MVIAITLVLSSCYYDKADLLYVPQATCDTTATVSYLQNVSPLLQQYCSGCHSGTSPDGGINVGYYAADKAIALNGKLYGTIIHASGYSPMPAGEPMLTGCQIATIKKWIDSNSPNN